MSISAIGGVSGASQSLINMASYNLFFNNDAPPPPPQVGPASMVSALMQILVKVMQPGGSGLGQGGGQRGGSSYQGDCHGGNAEAAQGSDGAASAEGAAEATDGLDLHEGAHGLVDAISGLLAAIAPLLSAMGGGNDGGGGSGLSTNDDAASLAALLSASGF